MDERNVKIRQYIEVARRALNRLEECLGEGLPILETPQVLTTQAVKEDQSLVIERKQHINKLMEIDCWPLAINVTPSLISPSDRDKMNRAVAVFDRTLPYAADETHFLDLGCGEGWITKEAKNRGFASCTGYDIVTDSNWSDEVTFTTDANELKDHFYDVILLYDVLDHCLDPMGVMDIVKRTLRLGGKVYVRCHPWTSKHAMHLYKDGLNKAYFHLFLQWEEIKELIQKDPMMTRKELNPLEAYHWWFSDFNVEKEKIVRSKEPLSDFFKVQSFIDLMVHEQQIPKNRIQGFMSDMEIDFVDFCLTHKG